MDQFERIADGKALDEIRRTPGFYALERLLKKARIDALESLTSVSSGKLDVEKVAEVRGKLAVLDEIVASVDAEIAYVRELVREDEETVKIQRGQAIDGGGTGDLT